MTKAELRKTVLDTLGDIAPEADLAALPPGKDLRQELDIDSMDFLNFVIALHEKLGVDTEPTTRSSALWMARSAISRPDAACTPRDRLGERCHDCPEAVVR